jgi:hypothetical protein
LVEGLIEIRIPALNRMVAGKGKAGKYISFLFGKDRKCTNFVVPKVNRKCSLKL